MEIKVSGYGYKGLIDDEDRGGNDDNSCWFTHLDPDVEIEMDIEWRKRRIEPCISGESTHNKEGTADEKDDDGRCIKNGAK